ncbi:MAG: hypothetical protein NTX33_11295 [Propionibacteriales bacterium]|nr:hypothetical protein [Propionibacteriales bacterium]
MPALTIRIERTIRPAGEARPRRRRTLAALVTGLLALGLLSTSYADASGGDPPSNTAWDTVTPGYKALASTVVGANTTKLVTISGSPTPVPTNATLVKLTVTVKTGTKQGTLWLTPNVPGTTAQGGDFATSWDTTSTVTFSGWIRPGQKNQVRLNNSSATSATVSVVITGYSNEAQSKASNVHWFKIDNQGQLTASSDQASTLQISYLPAFGIFELWSTEYDVLECAPQVTSNSAPIAFSAIPTPNAWGVRAAGSALPNNFTLTLTC